MKEKGVVFAWSFSIHVPDMIASDKRNIYAAGQTRLVGNSELFPACSLSIVTMALVMACQFCLHHLARFQSSAWR